MTHFEERVERDLKDLRDRVSSLAAQVSTALENALRALLGGNRELAYATVLGDLPINRIVREIDKLCHRFIALHLPSGGHLRLISSIIRANIELERIGDYAVTISRHSVQLSEPPSGSIARELALMGEEARSVLRQATQAFLEGNAETAKATMPAADREHEIFGIAFQDLVEREPDHKLRDLFGLFGVLNLLERVADQAKNICEETVFAVTGETKAAKVYRVLFLDEDNSCMSQMAEAIARKSFPGSGTYRSAGRVAAGALYGGLAEFLGDRGINLGDAQPKRLDLAPAELEALHVIVMLQGSIGSHIARTPFNTTVLDWDVGELPAGAGADKNHERFEALYRDLARRIRSLMETLRGEDPP